MFKKLYHKFIEPRQRDPDTRGRVIVLNVMLAGTMLILLAACSILVYDSIQAASFGNLRPQSFSLVIATLFIGLLYWLSRTGRPKTASVLLVSLYFLIGAQVIYAWGILVPTGVLVLGLVITLGGILLGPSFSLYVAGACSLLILGLQLAAENGSISPDWSWLKDEPTLGDAVSLVLLFIIMAVVSWMFNFQMYRSLRRATAAEAALTKQKSLLETTVEKRTQELQATQLEKIREMYRFAELGQLSTALLHDLANHLTTLTVEIEGLEGQTRSRALGRAKRSIKYIDDMVVRVRDQLHGKSDVRPFNIIDETNEVIKMLRHKAMANDALIKWQVPADKKELRVRGEQVRFRQLMANLISNAIDAYYEPRNLEEKRDVVIEVKRDTHNITITVDDWGRGIPKAARDKLFEPFYSTKQTGMGMGLYIARQIVEEHFLGEIKIDETKDFTSFVVNLPRINS